MKTLIKEVNQTIRFAMRGWPETGRLLLIVTVIAGLAVVVSHAFYVR